LKAILILSDLHNKDCANHLNKIKKAAGNKFLDFIIIQIVVQEIEAWYLAIPDAIEAAFPSLRPFPVQSGKTDLISNPKRKLSQVFFSRINRYYRVTSDGPKIARHFFHQASKSYPNDSFNRFIRKISELN